MTDCYIYTDTEIVTFEEFLNKSIYRDLYSDVEIIGKLFRYIQNNDSTTELRIKKSLERGSIDYKIIHYSKNIYKFIYYIDTRFYNQHKEYFLTNGDINELDKIWFRPIVK